MIKIFTTGGTIEGYDYDRPEYKQKNIRTLTVVLWNKIHQSPSIL